MPAAADLLANVGARVRGLREQRGWTQRELAERAGLSLRFLSELERGGGNISLKRFGDVAGALGVAPAALLAEGNGHDAPTAFGAPRPAVALLGVRGAGKSTIGSRLAAALGVRFVELDALIEEAAGLSLAEIFELHGEAYYHRLQRETLRSFLTSLPRAATGEKPLPAAVLATGGSLVTDRETWRLLRTHAITVWLKARPEDHWNRVIQQGDQRPMAENPHAFSELRALLDARTPLYAESTHTVDTSSLTPAAAVAELRDRLLGRKSSKAKENS